MATEDLQLVASELESSVDPETVAAILGRISAGDFSLVAIDLMGDPNVGVTTFPRGPLGLETLAVFAEMGVEEAGGTVLTSERVSISGTEALHLVTEASYPAGVAEQHFYYVLAGEIVYIITFTSFTPEQHREMFTTVMETFTLVP